MGGKSELFCKENVFFVLFFLENKLFDFNFVFTSGNYLYVHVFIVEFKS